MSYPKRKSANYKHGQVHTSLYDVWRQARQRCRNVNNKDYMYYGAKGITFSEEWDSFTEFLIWAYTQGGYQKGLTLERMDYTKGYEPSNCTFISKGEQAKNMSTNVRIEYNGETKIQKDWARTLQVSERTIWVWRKRKILEQKFNEYIKRMQGNES